MLYLLHDLMHHTKFHAKSSSTFATVSESLQAHLVDLIGYASAYDAIIYGRHHRKIGDLLNLWENDGFYPPAQIKKLKKTISDAEQAGYPATGRERQTLNGTLEEASGQSKDAPYIMPPLHGDVSMPFYDLPAASMMPHILPNRSTPINPQHVKPLELTAGPADETLTIAVKDFLKDVDELYEAVDGQAETLSMNMDALGQPFIRDELTGEIIRGEGYYGWSQEFCEKMKSKYDGKDRIGQDVKRGQSPDRSTSPFKRRRLSYSDRSESRPRSRFSSRSFSRSRSRARGGVYERRRRSYSRSRSQSPRRDPPERSRHNRSRSPQRPRQRSNSRSRSISYSPPPYRTTSAGPPPPLTALYPRSSATPPMPFPNSFNGTFPIPPHGLPIPPPPPPNYRGIWPPPPPPLPLPGQSPPVHIQPFSTFSNPVPPPPPPPATSGQLPPSGPILDAHWQAQMAPSNWLGQQPGNNQGHSYGGRGRAARGGQSGWSR